MADYSNKINNDDFWAGMRQDVQFYNHKDDDGDHDDDKNDHDGNNKEMKAVYVIEIRAKKIMSTI